MIIGLSLRGHTAGRAFQVLGLVAGQALIGTHSSIIVSVQEPDSILSLAWGSQPGGDIFGTGSTPTDFASGLGGRLYLTVTTTAGVFRRDFEIVGDVYVSNVPDVHEIIVSDNGDGSSAVTLSGAEQFAGVYQVQNGNLETGYPVLIRAAEWQIESASNAYELTPPLWLVPADNPATFNHKIVDYDGVELAQTTSFTPSSPTQGYFYAYDAENFAGATVAPSVIIQPATPTLINFDDSNFRFFTSEYDTRKISLAIKLTIDLDQTMPAYQYTLLSDVLRLDWNGSDYRVQVRKILNSVPEAITLGTSGLLDLSLILTADLDTDVRLDVHTGSGWETLLHQTDMNVAETVISQAMSIGSQNSNKTGPAFTLHHQFWQHNDLPDDFETFRDTLFDADGTWNDILPDGTVAGVRPIWYFKGTDFITGQNSGSGEEAFLSRAPIVVTEVQI